MPAALRDVRYQEQSGKHLLTVNSSQFDPTRTLRADRFGSTTPSHNAFIFMLL
jgi:hypothetical protein